MLLSRWCIGINVANEPRAAQTNATLRNVGLTVDSHQITTTIKTRTIAVGLATAQRSEDQRTNVIDFDVESQLRRLVAGGPRSIDRRLLSRFVSFTCCDSYSNSRSVADWFGIRTDRLPNGNRYFFRAVVSVVTSVLYLMQWIWAHDCMPSYGAGS